MNGDFTQAQGMPWRYGFLNLMRRVNVQLCTVPAGSAWQPRMEKFRLGQTPALTFAPREIASVSWQEGRLHVSLYSLGLWGPNGPLPLHYTELARNRTESYRDPTLTCFTDLFHHRWLTQFYQPGAAPSQLEVVWINRNMTDLPFISPASAGKICEKV